MQKIRPSYWKSASIHILRDIEKYCHGEKISFPNIQFQLIETGVRIGKVYLRCDQSPSFRWFSDVEFTILLCKIDNLSVWRLTEKENALNSNSSEHYQVRNTEDYHCTWKTSTMGNPILDQPPCGDFADNSQSVKLPPVVWQAHSIKCPARLPANSQISHI